MNKLILIAAIIGGIWAFSRKAKAAPVSPAPTRTGPVPTASAPMPIAPTPIPLAKWKYFIFPNEVYIYAPSKAVAQAFYYPGIDGFNVWKVDERGLSADGVIISDAWGLQWLWASPMPTAYGPEWFEKGT